MSDSIFTLDNVSFRYGDGREVLRNASLEIPSGRFVLLQGPSGAGKSTLLRLFIRLEEPTAGEVRYRGNPLDRWGPPQLRREVAYIQQTPTVVPGTVRENLLLPFGFEANGDLERPGDDRLRMLLDRFLLQNVEMEAEAVSCSVGEKQRLCLIRALLLEPRVLLMDEPTSALDRESGRMVEQAAEELHAEDGMTVIIISHGSYRPDAPHMLATLRDGTLSETASQRGGA